MSDIVKGAVNSHKQCQRPYYLLIFFVIDIGVIWSRLFDHRPFLNGEIRYTLHEFEVSTLIFVYCIQF